MSTVTSRYLSGNFAPVEGEIEATDLAISGRLPSELEGRYLRNGPNPIGPLDPATYHWFTGTGMVHGVRLRGGRAEWYRNRWVRSREVATRLGEPVPPGPLHGDMDFAANTNVIGLAGRTFAIVEGGSLPIELTYDLDTVGACDFGGTLPNGYTAHPHADPDTGELHAMAYWWGLGNVVQYLVIDRDARVTKVVPVECTGSPMMHDFGLSEHHVLVLDLPCVFDMDAAVAGASLPYRWNPDYPARVGLLPRTGGAGDVRWFEVEPSFVFHPMNAYDEGDRVVMDVCRHPRMFADDTLGPNEGAPTLDRWTFDLSSGKTIEERIDDRGQEFPRFDERLQGKSYRYGYTVGAAKGLRLNGFLKHDFVAGTSEHRQDGCEYGELVFVPRAGGTAEDDGWMIGYRYQPERSAGELVVLNAADITGEPQAVVHLPQRVPNGFHGNWVAD